MNDPALVALACLPAMSPLRLRHLLRHHSPDDAFERLRSGAALSPMVTRHITAEGVAALRQQAAHTSIDAAVERCVQAGISVVDSGDADWPPSFACQPDAPAALFVRGALSALTRRRVGIVGTRNATAAGRATAHQLGHDLAEAGITVVSGLARGIDGAAHLGVMSVPPGNDLAARGLAAAVVGSGLDVPYPLRHRELWERVGQSGVLLSEHPPGARPEPWHFPLRNRIIAALSEVLVVVESRERGGSLITANCALDLGVEVMVVPGSTHSRASAGTNQLLFDGASIVRSADDVLTQLGLDHSRRHEVRDHRLVPSGLQADVLAACQDQPSTLDMIVVSVGCAVTEAALAAARLEQSGWLIEAGGWFEPTTSRLSTS